MALIPSIMSVYIVSMYVPIAKVVPTPPGFTWERFLIPLIPSNPNESQYCQISHYHYIFVSNWVRLNALYMVLTEMAVFSDLYTSMNVFI